MLSKGGWHRVPQRRHFCKQDCLSGVPYTPAEGSVLGHVLALVLSFAGQKQPELCSGTGTSFRTRRGSTDGALPTLAMLEPLLLCSSRAKASRARAPELLCGAETYFWVAILSGRAAAVPLPAQSR